jgi:hypothetical protein
MKAEVTIVRTAESRGKQPFADEIYPVVVGVELRNPDESSLPRRATGLTPMLEPECQMKAASIQMKAASIQMKATSIQMKAASAQMKAKVH